MIRAEMTARCGVVLIDVVMMLAVLGVVIVAIIPSARPGESMKLVAATTVMTADIEYAQSATLSQPSDPTIIRFDEDGTRYWLALASDPETPIMRGNGVDPYEVVFGEGAFREMWGVALDVQDLTDQTLRFDAMGRLVQSENGVIRFGNGLGELAVVIRATTGSVTVVDGAMVPVEVPGEDDTPPVVVPPEPVEEPAPTPVPEPPPIQGGKKGGVFGIGILGL